MANRKQRRKRLSAKFKELALSPPTAPAPDQYVPDQQTTKTFNVSYMTLGRWTRDPDLGFPKPVKIAGRNYRSRRELDQFLERKKQETLAALGMCASDKAEVAS